MPSVRFTFRAEGIGRLKTELEEAKSDEFKKVLEDVADYVCYEVDARDDYSGSPVDTGAYVQSHSFVETGSGGGRVRTSRRKSKGQDIMTNQDIARMQLQDDIEDLSAQRVDRASLVNRSPHAEYVENGNDKYAGYMVYAKTQARFS